MKSNNNTNKSVIGSMLSLPMRVEGSLLYEFRWGLTPGENTNTPRKLNTSGIQHVTIQRALQTLPSSK